ncbi:hypothetical protein L2E82_13517 [Cichorium intybus]|uniref:Uncharacterized protein n=1 Tax=Cichorium intybus TaxID=13427 RepID=A0ACB9EXM1_CICIN|nr:hypothetical protein L2E82_13517 [Cichorium intybus]
MIRKDTVKPEWSIFANSDSDLLAVSVHASQLDVDIPTRIHISDHRLDQSKDSRSTRLLIDLVKIVTDIDVAVESGEFDTVQLCAQASRHLCLPGSRFLLSKSNREIKSLKMEVERLLMEIIQSRRDCVEIGRSSSYGNDLLGMLLNEMQKKRGENGFSLNLQVCNGGSPSVEHLSKLNLYTSLQRTGDEMGLGKTLQTISFLMILCPLNVTDGWVSEVKQFAPKLTVLRYVGDKQCRRTLKHVQKQSSSSHTLKNAKQKLQQTPDETIWNRGRIVKRPKTHQAPTSQETSTRNFNRKLESQHKLKRAISPKESSAKIRRSNSSSDQKLEDRMYPMWDMKQLFQLVYQLEK